MSNAPEGTKKTCFKCNTKITYVRVSPDKLQWQNDVDGKAHYTFISEKNYKCNLPGPVESKPEPPKEDTTIITPKTPHEEAELIVSWASERAYKMTMKDVPDYSKLTTQEKSGLGQKHGMLTRLLADCTIELIKHNGIKSKYGNPGGKDES